MTIRQYLLHYFFDLLIRSQLIAERGGKPCGRRPR